MRESSDRRKGGRDMDRVKQRGCILIILLGFMVILVPLATAASTQIHVVKYANDRSTILAEQTLTYQQMRDTLPVMGDGVTHYFHQGPVFVDDADPVREEALRWNPGEDTNVQEKDMGAVKGTDVRDLCDLVGGMSDGDTLVLKASDGMTREFAYKNVYNPSSRQGAMVITWYCAGSTFSACTGPYPDSGYSDGMRIVFFADTSVKPGGIHAFGNYDWHESADPKYWYYYQSGGEKYPTTTGLSVKYISEIQIYSTKPPGASPAAAGAAGGGGSSVLPSSGTAPPENPLLYGYSGKKLGTFTTGTLNGTLRIFSDPEGMPVVVSNRIRNFNLSADLPPKSNITLARLYVYVSKSRGLQTDQGVIPPLYVTLNGTSIEKDQMYIDTDGDDHRYVSATYAYDIRDLMKGNGTYTVSARNPDFEQVVFTIESVMLVTAYEDETEPATTFWIDEGCDVISSLPEKGLLPDDCKTTFSFAGTVNMSRAHDADLYVISTGFDRENTTEHTVSFNKGTSINLFDTRTSGNATLLPVMEYLNETGNAVSVQSSIGTKDADYLVNRNAILIVKQQDPGAPAGMANRSENEQYASSPVAGESSPSGNESTSCQLALDTDPEGALVYLDGLYLGKTTPYTLDIDKGTTHTVRFELEGYSPAETSGVTCNSTSIRTSLYSPVYSMKGRQTEDLRDPDGIRYGGLYVYSRPRGAMIFIDGITTGRTAPSVIMGLKPGIHTINVVLDSHDPISKGANEFFFEDQKAVVLPDVMIPVEINGLGYTRMSDIIVDSHMYRGISFTVNGYPPNATVPAKVRAGQFDSFITIHENNTFISYPIPFLLDDDRYFLFRTRDYQNLSIAVDSSPRGAEVFIDGFRTGFSTPYTFDHISDGSHRIMVSKPGYLPQQRLINLPLRSVPIPQTSIRLTLEEYPNGFLYVNSNPEGAEVFIDGLSSGEITPALFKSLQIGTHSVKMTGRNATKVIPDISINSLKFTNISVDLNGFAED